MGAAPAEAFNGLDVLAGGLRNRKGARAGQRAVHVNAACAAQSCPAAEFGSSQLQGVAQNPEKRSVGLNINVSCDAVYLQGEAGHGLGKPENILDQIAEKENGAKHFTAENAEKNNSRGCLKVRKGVGEKAESPSISRRTRR